MEDIIVSKVRVKILQLFLSSQDPLFHVREIVRLVDEEINAVRRELARMEKNGMVTSEWRANRRLYAFRKDYPFFGELLAMVAKSQGIGGDIVKGKNKLGKVKYAMVATRFIRNQESAPDDVDLLIVGQIVLPELQAIVATEQAKREREINYSFMDEAEFSFRVKRRDPFILKVLVQSKIMLIGDEQEMLEGLVV
jgi:DNA-binding transcriptional ArsR family regulator